MTETHAYLSLRRILADAYDQAAVGKGAKRHADERPWDDQPIMRIAEQHGVGFLTGQASKKLGEAAGMIRRDEIERARHEMLGAIVYAAGAILWCEQQIAKAPEDRG